MTKAAALKLARKLLDDNRLFEWDVVFTRDIRSAGACVVWKRQIEISYPIMVSFAAIETQDTIIHEVAHALTNEPGHGPQWRREYRRLGGTSQKIRTNDDLQIRPIPARFTAVCPANCGYTYPWARRPKVNRSCPRCSGGVYSENYKLIIVDNGPVKLKLK